METSPPDQPSPRWWPLRSRGAAAGPPRWLATVTCGHRGRS